MTIHAFGRTTIEISGDDPISRYLQSELECLPSVYTEAKIVCRRVDSLPPTAEFSHSFGRISVGESGFRIDFGAWAAEIRFQGDTTDLAFATSGRARLENRPEIWQRGRNWNFLDVNEEIGKGVVYDALDQAIQLTQLKVGQTFVHCSAIEIDGEVDVIGGWGGAGKTSSVMDLVLDGEYRFLSDDLGIIADDGTFYRSPKRIQIYPYNLEGSPELEHRLLSGRGYIDTLQWRVRKRLKGMKGVRRRVTAEQFFGNENVASQGRVRRFIHLERSFLDAPRLTEVASTEIARRSSHVLVHELNPLHEVGAAANAANLPSRLTTETWRAEAETHLAAALSTVPCFEMRVPMKTTPSELVRLFRTIDG